MPQEDRSMEQAGLKIYMTFDRLHAHLMKSNYFFNTVHAANGYTFLGHIHSPQTFYSALKVSMRARKC